MLKIYKKSEKSSVCPMGYMEINPETVDKPFLMCISAQDNLDKSIYGTIREGARAARLYTTQEIGAAYSLNDFPLDFLGFRFVKNQSYINNYEEFVDCFLLPYLIGNGTYSINEIKKRARMANFMTYCNGTETYKLIEAYLEKKMLECGYLQVEIDGIISQIACVSIGTAIDTSNIKATSACFIDLEDDEISTEKTPTYANILNQNQQNSIFGELGSKQNVLYFYNGSGNHSLKEYLSDHVKVKPALCSVISYIVANSIKNIYSDELVPISSGEIIDVLRVYGGDKDKTDELLVKLDNNIDYTNASKYNKDELRLRIELDQLYKEHLKTKFRLERKERDLEEVKDKLTKVDEAVRKYSSDTTYLQIFCESGLYQAPIGVNPFKVKSDREIREEQEKSSNFVIK